MNHNYQLFLLNLMVKFLSHWEKNQIIIMKKCLS